MTLAARLTGLAVTVIVISVGISTFIADRQARKALETHLGAQLLAIVNSVAPQIDGDLHSLIQVDGQGALAAADEFERERQVLVKVKTANRLESKGSPIYTLRPSADFPTSQDLEFVVMTDHDETGQFFTGNRYHALPHHFEALAGRPATTGLYADSEGLWISAAAPIFDATGTVVGIVQADRHVDFVQAESRRQMLGMLVGALISTVIAGGLAACFARGMVKPFRRLVRATENIAAGNFDEAIVIDRTDEVGELATSFNQMAKRLKATAEIIEQTVQQRTGELRASEARYRSLVAASCQVVWHTDAAGAVTDDLPEWRALTGQSRAAIHGTGWQDAIHPEDRAPAVAQWTRARQARQTFDAEFRLRTADGEFHAFAVRSVPVLDHEQVIREWVGTCTDLTERRAAEEALHLAEVKFRSLVEQLPAITYHAALGETCTWTYVSPQVFPMLGFTPEEWLASDRLWFEHIHPDDQEFPNEAELVAKRTGSFLAEYRMFTRAGELRWFRDQAVLVPAPDRGRDALYGVMMDITEAKAADERLAGLNQQLVETSRLAGMAEVATGVLHNVGNVLNSVNISASILVERLRGSKVANLKKAAALLTGQNGSLAHFLTEDPQGIKLPGYLAKLGEHLSAENASLLAEADHLGRNLEHIKEIVAMQQSYAKVSGAFEFLALEELVNDAIAMNAGAFERHAVTIERRFSPAPPARVDRHKMLQILINLLRNAKHAFDEVDRPDKRITISIEPAGDAVRVAVADNGIGIPAENLDRIFGHGFTTRKSGHGFGLHSGANAAKEMGGTLTATSGGRGLGATFTIELPTNRTPAATPTAIP